MKKLITILLFLSLTLSGCSANKSVGGGNLLLKVSKDKVISNKVIYETTCLTYSKDASSSCLVSTTTPIVKYKFSSNIVKDADSIIKNGKTYNENLNKRTPSSQTLESGRERMVLLYPDNEFSFKNNNWYVTQEATTTLDLFDAQTSASLMEKVFGFFVPSLQASTSLTTGTSWSIPADWNSASNTVECIGGGGGGSGNGGTGGGGGAYSKKSNITLTPSGSATYNVGGNGNGSSGGGSLPTIGGGTWFNGATYAAATVAAAGARVVTIGVYGFGGLAASSTGDVKYDGGNSGGGGVNGAGGGGAAGTKGIGGNGATDAGNGVGGNSNNGTLSGGGYNANGQNGTEFDATHGSGSGGGGSNGAGAGGTGGHYGAGGGGSKSGTGGPGYQGLIVINYTAAAASRNKSIINN